MLVPVSMESESQLHAENLADLDQGGKKQAPSEKLVTVHRKEVVRVWRLSRRHIPRDRRLDMGFWRERGT